MFPTFRLHVSYNPALYQADRLLEPETHQHHQVALFEASCHTRALWQLVALIDAGKVNDATELCDTLKSVGELGSAIADDLCIHLDQFEKSLTERSEK